MVKKEDDVQQDVLIGVPPAAAGARYVPAVNWHKLNCHAPIKRWRSAPPGLAPIEGCYCEGCKTTFDPNRAVPLGG